MNNNINNNINNLWFSDVFMGYRNGHWAKWVNIYEVLQRALKKVCFVVLCNFVIFILK